MRIGIVQERMTGEHRVAIVPAQASALMKAGHELLVETNAGRAAGFDDESYSNAGATIVKDRAKVFAEAEVMVQVRTPPAARGMSDEDLEQYRAGQFVIGFAEPLTAREPIEVLAQRGVSVYAMEMVPRTTRAQTMDALSSQATIAGYRAVLHAAMHLPKMFPMMMTAAGTLAPARSFVIGAGVAGLQAIATSRRLGAVVTGYDIRPAVKEQVESLGARFLVLDLPTESAEGKGGYAKAMDEAFYRKQQEAMAQAVRTHDVVITTAAIPGREAPKLISADMVHGMTPGSIIVDLAAERGGNCELTKPDEVVDVNGVKILGPTNLPAEAPNHASQMYSRNVASLLEHLAGKEKSIDPMRDDEIAKETLICHGGAIVHPRVRSQFGLSETTAEKGAGA